MVLDRWLGRSLCYVLLPAATTSESRANGSGRRSGASTNTTANGYQHTKLTNPIDFESIFRLQNHEQWILR